MLPCTNDSSGTAMFSVGLLIQTRRGKPIPGTPLRLNLRKECALRGTVFDRASLTSSSQGTVCFYFLFNPFLHFFIPSSAPFTFNSPPILPNCPLFLIHTQCHAKNRLKPKFIHCCHGTDWCSGECGNDVCIFLHSSSLTDSLQLYQSAPVSHFCENHKIIKTLN